MRKKLVAGNWKMHMDWNESMTFLSEFVAKESSEAWGDVDVLIAPPFPYLRHFVEFTANARSAVKVGAQNCATEEAGAYTGEVSAKMLASLGVPSVILGHSERRSLYGEDAKVVGQKVRKALEAGLQPIFCCGESLEERENNVTEERLRQQLEESVLDLDSSEFEKLVIAYEPVWAIGTGKTATPEQAQETHAFIRQLINDRYGAALAQSIRILYGGSVKPGNAKELFAQPDIDGGLVGGASLKVDDFAEIVRCAF